MKCAIIAVRYSDNLGDGIIYEVLSRCLQYFQPNLEIISIDLSGRTSFINQYSSRRKLLTSLIVKFPRFIRPLFPLVKFGIFERNRLLKHFSENLADCDFAIIGGGHLLADANLNFPTKLAVLANALHKKGLPVAFYAVGASRWSRPAQWLIQRVFRQIDLRWLSVRDSGSRGHIAHGFGSSCLTDIRVTYDPAVACSRFIAIDRPPASSRKRIGLNIIGPEWLILDSNRRCSSPSFGTDSYLALAKGILMRGHDVVLMTNGAEEDNTLLLQIADKVEGRYPSGRVTILPRPQDPETLIRQIVSLDGLISHRLHANIVAYSYGVPTVGLEWDSKVPAFFESVELLDYCLSVDDQKPANILSTLDDALTRQDDSTARNARIEAILSHLSSLLNSLKTYDANLTGS